MVAKKTSEDFTLILKLKKFSSSNIFILFCALSTKASGQGSLYFSSKFFSKEPALTPILIEQSWSFAAFNISWTLYFDPMFPWLILKQWAPDTAASIALL